LYSEIKKRYASKINKFLVQIQPVLIIQKWNLETGKTMQSTNPLIDHNMQAIHYMISNKNRYLLFVKYLTYSLTLCHSFLSMLFLFIYVDLRAFKNILTTFKSLRYMRITYCSYSHSCCGSVCFIRLLSFKWHVVTISILYFENRSLLLHK